MTRRSRRHLPPDKPADTPAAPAPDAAKPQAAPKPPATMNIDFDGLVNRVARVPAGAENYFGLSAKTGHLLYVVGGAAFYGRPGDRTPSLRIYALKEKKKKKK